MRLIIFTGPPAGGKSSIAKYVSDKTGIRYISKDDCKIELFEKYGFRSHDEKKRLSIQGEKDMHGAIERAVRAGEDIIVDNNYKTYDDVRKILDGADTDVTVICIRVMADYEKLAERYNDRIRLGDRHSALYTLNQYPVVWGVSEFHPVITREDVDRIEQGVTEKTFGENVLEINTDAIEADFEQICVQVLDYIERFREA